MDSLIQLVKLLSPNKLKEIAFLNAGDGKDAKVNVLYQSVIDGETDEKVLQDLLFKDSVYKKPNYNRIKRQLEDRLINTLFLIDANKPKYNEITDAYYACYKYASAVKILLGKKARKAAISIAEKTYKLAERFEFTDILLNLSRDLRSHYGSIIGDKRKFNYFNRKVKLHTETLLAELKAEEYYSELALHFSTSRALKLEYQQKAIAHAEELEKVIHDFSSYRFKLWGYIVIAIRYEITKDFMSTIDTCDQALRFFRNKKHFASKTALYIFYFRKISSLIMLGMFKEAEETTEVCLNLESSGLHNWYQTQEYRFIIFLHTGDYQNAYDVYRESVEHPNYSNQYPTVREAWYIYEAYIYYFYLRGAIKGSLNERLKKFRLNKFLNEVPTYSKDKRGMNIAILILQVLFLLHQEKYGKIIDRVEALRTYTHRYLRRDETFRSNCFIKMLMQLPKANFHKAAVIRKTADLREKLSSVGIRHNQSAEVEAVPYEVMWEFVLGSLKNKIH